MITAWSAGLRDEAAHGLVQLFARPVWRDSEHGLPLASTVESLLADPSPLVRMQASDALPYLHLAERPEQQLVAVRGRLLAETNPHVLTMLVNQLHRLASKVPTQMDDTLAELAQLPTGVFLRDRAQAVEPDQSAQASERPADADADDDTWSGGHGPADRAAPLLAYLAVVPQTPFASTTLAGWFNDPIANKDRVVRLLHDLRPYLNNRDGTGRDNAFRLLDAAAKAATDIWLDLHPQTGATERVGEPARARARDAAVVVHDIVQQVYFASGAFDDQPGADQEPERGDPETFASHSLPILRLCAQVTEPQVIQPIVETLIHLTEVLKREALMAVAAAVPERSPYLTDSHAATTVISYLRRLLAQHRDLVLGDEDGISAFRHLLQAFAGAGHSDALSLAYTFADVFR